MARYIDAEQFRGKHVVAEIDGKLNSVIPYADIVYAPTADVVPKSEVDELIYKLECLLCHATGGRLSKHTYDLRTMETVVTDYINESYSDGMAEVARAIFEEIESLLRLNSMQGDIFTGKYFDVELEADIAELKKKYREDN